jgi:polycomb protein EED
LVRSALPPCKFTTTCLQKPSVAFFGDCILSRACYEDVIVLWRIEGFSSKDPPPRPETAPSAHEPKQLTRSAFVRSNAQGGQDKYTRLLKFHTPGCGQQFFNRFSISTVPGLHPILGYYNASSKIFFWDMSRMTSYHEFITAVRDPDKTKTIAELKPGWLRPIAHRKKAGDAAKSRDKEKDQPSDKERIEDIAFSSDPYVIQQLATEYSLDTIDDWENKYNMSDPDHEVRAHKTEKTKGPAFLGRQVAWSPEGEWCVVVGNQTRAFILQRGIKGDHAEEAE